MTPRRPALLPLAILLAAACSAEVGGTGSDTDAGPGGGPGPGHADAGPGGGSGPDATACSCGPGETCNLDGQCVAPLPVGAPLLYFTDLDSGPATGWQGGSAYGAAVTVWGRNLGP